MLLAGLAWATSLVTAARLSAAGRRVDTYVAIWGPHLRSPLLDSPPRRGRA
jgi:hypothetical protein